MENKQKQCPFLIFEGDVPKCKVKHQTGGIEHGYLPMPASDISKCTELFEKCPIYRGANKKTCINCGTTFLKDEGGLIYINDKPIVTCPGCGSSGVDRQIPEAASPDVTVEEEEVVGEEE
jgi:hypothetical protein